MCVWSTVCCVALFTGSWGLLGLFFLVRVIVRKMPSNTWVVLLRQTNTFCELAEPLKEDQRIAWRLYPGNTDLSLGTGSAQDNQVQPKISLASHQYHQP